jgi:hypothetical protein
LSNIALDLRSACCRPLIMVARYDYNFPAVRRARVPARCVFAANNTNSSVVTSQRVLSGRLQRMPLSFYLCTSLEKLCRPLLGSVATVLSCFFLSLTLYGTSWLKFSKFLPKLEKDRFVRRQSAKSPWPCTGQDRKLATPSPSGGGRDACLLNCELSCFPASLIRLISPSCKK